MPNMYPCHTGGMEVYNHSLVSNLTGDNVMVLTCCRKVKAPHIRYLTWRLFLIRRFGLGDLSLSLSLLWYLIRHRGRFSVIYSAYTSNAAYLGYILPLVKHIFGIPYVIHHHGGGMKPWKTGRPHRRLFREAWKVFAVSETIRSEYEKRSGRSIGLVLPLLEFRISSQSKETLRQKYSLEPDSKIILFVGSLKPLKAPGVLVQAFINLGRDQIINKKLRLIMVGQGPLLEELREKVSREGFTDFIMFTGLKQREEVASYYRLADYYVIPSHFEGTPLSLLEAMANKLACIGTDVNGIKEIIGDSQGGILFPKDDTQELTRCLEQLIHDDSLKIELQEKSYAYFRKNYNYEQYLHHFLEALQQSH